MKHRQIVYIWLFAIAPVKIIRIFHGCEVWIEKSIQGSLFGITRLCLVMSNSDPKGWIFPAAPNNHDRFVFLHTFWSPAFEFNVGVTISKSSSYMLASDILKVDVVCDVAMTSTPDILTELCDLLNHQCIDKTCCYSFFISPTLWIRLCKIRFVSTGKNHWKPGMKEK